MPTRTKKRRKAPWTTHRSAGRSAWGLRHFTVAGPSWSNATACSVIDIPLSRGGVDARFILSHPCSGFLDLTQTPPYTGVVRLGVGRSPRQDACCRSALSRRLREAGARPVGGGDRETWRQPSGRG